MSAPEDPQSVRVLNRDTWKYEEQLPVAILIGDYEFRIAERDGLLFIESTENVIPHVEVLTPDGVTHRLKRTAYKFQWGHETTEELATDGRYEPK